MKLIGILHVRPNFQKITYNKIARAMKPFFFVQRILNIHVIVRRPTTTDANEFASQED